MAHCVLVTRLGFQLRYHSNADDLDLIYSCLVVVSHATRVEAEAHKHRLAAEDYKSQLDSESARAQSQRAAVESELEAARKSALSAATQMSQEEERARARVAELQAQARPRQGLRLYVLQRCCEGQGVHPTLPWAEFAVTILQKQQSREAPITLVIWLCIFQTALDGSVGRATRVILRGRRHGF